MQAKRNGAWKKDGKTPGIYSRQLARGVAWGYYSRATKNVMQAGPTRQDALDAQAKDRLRDSAGLPAPDRRVRIRDLAAELREAKRGRLRPRSFQSLESGLAIIERELGHLKPAQVSAERIARLMRDLEAKGLKPGTIKRYLSPLSMILNLAVRRGAVSVNAMTLLNPEERPRDEAPRKAHEWTQTELRRLLRAAEDLDDRPEARQRYFPLIALLVYTGARIGEALALRWADVDFLAGTIEIKHSLSRTRELTPPKTRAGERTVAMPESLLRTLLGHKPEHATDEDFVFAARHGQGPLSYWNARDRGIVPALARAGLAGVRIHDLRHACASLLISRGLSPVEVAAQLGHANSSVTLQVYSHMFDRSLAHDRVREALDVLSSEPAT